MNRDDVIRMAREAGIVRTNFADRWDAHQSELEHFAELVAAAERAIVVGWMAEQGYATGHGDTTEDLLKEAEWQIVQREREACEQVCKAEHAVCWNNGAMAEAQAAKRCGEFIRARGER